MFQSVALSQTPPSKRRVPVECVSSDGAIAVADPPPKGALKKRTVCVETPSLSSTRKFDFGCVVCPMCLVSLHIGFPLLSRVPALPRCDHLPMRRL